MSITTIFFGKEYLKYGCAISAVIFILNLIIFNDKMLIKLEERWDGEPKSHRALKRMGVILYIMFSIAIFIISI